MHVTSSTSYQLKQVARPDQIPRIGKEATSPDGGNCRDFAAIFNPPHLILRPQLFPSFPRAKCTHPARGPLQSHPTRRSTADTGWLLVGLCLSRASLPACWDRGGWAQHEALRAGCLGKSPRSELEVKTGRKITSVSPLSFSLCVCLPFSFVHPPPSSPHCSLYLPSIQPSIRLSISVYYIYYLSICNLSKG